MDLKKSFKYWYTNQKHYIHTHALLTYSSLLLLFTAGFIAATRNTFINRYLEEPERVNTIIVLLLIFGGFLLIGPLLLIKKKEIGLICVNLLLLALASFGIIRWGIVHTYSLLLLLLTILLTFVWKPFKKALLYSATLILGIIIVGYLQNKNYIKYDYLSTSLRFQTADIAITAIILLLITSLTALDRYTRDRAYKKIQQLNKKVTAQNIELKRKLIYKINELFIKDEKIHTYKDLDTAYKTVVKSVNSKIEAQNLLHYRNAMLLSGVHDLNPSLMGLMQLAERQSPIDPKLLIPYLSKIKKKLRVVKEEYSSTSQHQKTNLSTLLNQLALSIIPLASKIKFVNEIKKDLIVTTEINSLNLIFSNLISNSVNALQNLEVSSKSAFEKVIKISSNIKNEKLIINIEDNGAPLSYETQAKLFKLGFTTSQHGSGIGLFISRELARNQLGGDLIFNLQNKHIKQFQLILPIRLTSVTNQ